MTRIGETQRECREQPALCRGLECPQKIKSLPIRQREMARGRIAMRPLAISLCLIGRLLIFWGHSRPRQRAGCSRHSRCVSPILVILLNVHTLSKFCDDGVVIAGIFTSKAIT